jgi:ubiquinol-cytochrome c reductase cytochrome c subunit
VSRRVEILMWIGVWGAPVAWAFSHVVGWGVTEADCGPTGKQWGISLHAWVAVLTTVAALLAAIGIAASVLAYRSIKGTGQDDPPPAGSTWLMSICGMVISPVMLMLILLTGSGVLLLGTGCASAQPVPSGIVRPDNEQALSDQQLGGQLFAGNCTTCHGVAGDGIPNRGPSLRGVGARAADFYLTTGYMPLSSPDEQPWRHRVLFTRRELRALVKYVASLGSGPPIPRPAPQNGRLAEGLRLFTQHCAGCHQVVGEGGYVTNARVPRLKQATPTQIAEAVRIGPYLMPRFSEKAISDRQLNSIIAYIQASKKPEDRGGWGIGHIGPVPEGLVSWFIALVLLVGLCSLIGERLRT